MRVWEEFPRARRHLPQARQRRRDPRLAVLSVRAAGQADADPVRTPPLLREGVHLSAGRRAVRLAVRHQRLPGPARAAADARSGRRPIRSLARAQPAARGRGFAAAFLFASVVPVYLVWLTPELFNFTVVAARRYFSGATRRSRRRAGRVEHAATGFLSPASLRLRGRRAARHRDVLEAARTHPA